MGQLTSHNTPKRAIFRAPCSTAPGNEQPPREPLLSAPASVRLSGVGLPVLVGQVYGCNNTRHVPYDASSMSVPR